MVQLCPQGLGSGWFPGEEDPCEHTAVRGLLPVLFYILPHLSLQENGP